MKLFIAFIYLTLPFSGFSQQQASPSKVKEIIIVMKAFRYRIY